jgi:hypothetical protein
MSPASILAQEGVNLPGGDGVSIVFWVISAAVILGLWFVISRTRKRSYDEYWERRRREEEQRLSDPDMAGSSVRDDEADDEPPTGDAGAS